jgi:hypothetical protein
MSKRELLQMALDALEKTILVYRGYGEYLSRIDVIKTTEATVALRRELGKPESDCNVCTNRGRVDGLSQETHCDHCIYQDQWRTDHYSKEDM